MNKPKLNKGKSVITGSIGILPLVPEPWSGSFNGQPITSLKVPYPPKLYSAEYASPLFYKTVHGEYFLGFWPGGDVTLCQHDNESDFCRTADGGVVTCGGKYGGPTWIMPLELLDNTQPQSNSITPP